MKIMTDEESAERIAKSICLGGILALLFLGFGLFIFGAETLKTGLFVLLSVFILAGLFI